jgi:HD-GYP domain-containing protein (c-di-GMP phosphodiesterase class II)
MATADDLERRLQEYETLLEIGVELASTLELDRVLHLALDKVEQFCRAETSSIWELDELRGELFFRVVRGRVAPTIRDLRVPLGEGIVGEVARSGRAEVVEDVTADPRWRGDATAGFVTRSLLSVPLVARGRVVGVLQVLNSTEREAFSADDLRRMELLAGPLANAIENARLYEVQRQTFLQTVTALAEAVERRDPYTGGHVRRVVDYSLAIGRRLALGDEELEELRLAAVLHDIGKIATPDRVLSKPSPLDDEETRLMRRHPVDGADLVLPIAQLRALLGGIRHHHERTDGQGYPDGLCGDEIPPLARIIAVADSFDAMTTDRPYRKGRAAATALDEIEREAGRQFCPRVVVAFRSVFDDGEIAACRQPSPAEKVAVTTGPQRES